MLRRVLTAALTVMATPAVAQDWTAMAPSGQTTAVGVRWENGTGAVARCGEGRFQILFAIPQSVAGETAAITIDDGDGAGPYETVWRMSPQGNATFARTPLNLTEHWLRGRTVAIVFPGGHERVLTPPGNTGALRTVLSDCNETIDVSLPERDIVITSPSWAQRPDGYIMARYYPIAAARQGVSGSVVINCVATSDGRLEDCITSDERPSNAGFGAASLAVIDQFRLNPRTENGRPVGESIVMFTMRWAMELRD